MSSSSQQSKTDNIEQSLIERVDYDALDKAKLSFIAASKKTLSFAQDFGFVPEEKLGASANLFSLNLEQYLNCSQRNIYITLIAEGLGTADDARPNDLTPDEFTLFGTTSA